MFYFSKRAKIIFEYKEFLRISELKLSKLHRGKLTFG